MNRPPSSLQVPEDILPPGKNPWVAAGALATAAVLCGGLIAFKQGNAELSQRMMRARVLAQGGTVALMVVSSGWYALQGSSDSAANKEGRW